MTRIVVRVGVDRLVVDDHDAGRLVVYHPVADGSQRLINRSVCASGHDIGVFFQQPPGDAHDLIHRLARAEDGLRVAAAQGPVVVHHGIAQVRIGKIFQCVQRPVHRHITGSHLLQHFF
jgi:hypothetical protein